MSFFICFFLYVWLFGDLVVGLLVRVFFGLLVCLVD